MIRRARRIPLGIQRVDEEGITLWPRMIIVLNKSKLGASETAKIVDSSERALPNHILEGDQGVKGQEIQKTHSNYNASSPIDKVELGQSIKQLYNEDLVPHDSGETVRLPSHGLPETRDNKRMI